jgi:uncharacterized protein YgbK (DUF1537 family)
MRSGVPIVVGVPQMRRYTFCGHLFAGTGAGTGSPIVRIDRHPTMSVHPVTPMNESDLRIHLAHQVAHQVAHQAPLRVGLMDMLSHRNDDNDDAERLLAQVLEDHDAVLFDVMDTPTQTRAAVRQ